MSVINTNVSALYAQNALKTNSRAMSTAMEQLSTGSRINSAKDDAAGLAIGQNMTSQVRGLNQAVRNLNDGVNMLQTAEGALVETSNMLQRMRELAVQSMNGTYSVTQRGYLNTEFAALSSQIGKIATETKWNDQKLLDGTVVGDGTNSGTFQYQAGMSSGQTIVVSIAAMTLTGLSFASQTGFAIAAVASGGTDIWGVVQVAGVSAVAAGVPAIDTVSRASTSLGLVTSALETINSQRAKIGAAINQMTYGADNLTNIASNISASRSTIMDTDYATATTQLSKTQIIQQAATAMLAQANQQPQSVLALLK
jgi:flagellin